MNEILTREELMRIEAMEYSEVQPILDYTPDFLDSFEEIEEEMDADIDIWARPEDDWSWNHTEAAGYLAA